MHITNVVCWPICSYTSCSVSGCFSVWFGFLIEPFAVEKPKSLEKYIWLLHFNWAFKKQKLRNNFLMKDLGAHFTLEHSIFTFAGCEAERLTGRKDLRNRMGIPHMFPFPFSSSSSFCQIRHLHSLFLRAVDKNVTSSALRAVDNSLPFSLSLSLSEIRPRLILDIQEIT